MLEVFVGTSCWNDNITQPQKKRSQGNQLKRKAFKTQAKKKVNCKNEESSTEEPGCHFADVLILGWNGFRSRFQGFGLHCRSWTTLAWLALHHGEQDWNPESPEPLSHKLRILRINLNSHSKPTSYCEILNDTLTPWRSLQTFFARQWANGRVSKSCTGHQASNG